MYILGYRVPWFIFVGFLLGLAFAFSIKFFAKNTPWSAARLWGSVGLVWYLPIVLSVTLAPRKASTAYSGCSTQLVADFSVWMQEDQRLLNVLLFVPLGFLTVFVTPQKKYFLASFLFLLSLPFLIEFLQMRSFINRSCDVNDIFDNFSGVFLGSFCGVATKSTVSMLLERRR